MKKKRHTPALQVREVPAEVYEALADRAKREHRSLSQQTLATLEEGLGLQGDRKQRRQRIIAATEQQAIPNADRLPDPVTLVREDRER